MIDPTEAAFPNNAVTAIAVAMATIDSDLIVLKRPLRPSDGGPAIGVWGALWTPDEESREIGHRPQGETTLSSYQLGVQSFVKDGDQERGLAAHAVLAARIRRVLYRDTALRLSFSSMSVTDGTFTEHFSRWTVGSQRFMNTDIEGTFIFASTVECRMETQVY